MGAAMGDQLGDGEPPETSKAELRAVRRKLEELTESRLLSPLDPESQAEYDQLATRESELLRLQDTTDPRAPCTGTPTPAGSGP
jgi:hypothetical protein